MNLTEIFSKLPMAVSFILEKQLDGIQVSKEPSDEEVLEAARQAAERTRTELVNLGTVNEDVLGVLEHLPSAVLKHLRA